jgi:hypothetical protein
MIAAVYSPTVELWKWEQSRPPYPGSHTHRSNLRKDVAPVHGPWLVHFFSGLRTRNNMPNQNSSRSNSHSLLSGRWYSFAF